MSIPVTLMRLPRTLPCQTVAASNPSAPCSASHGSASIDGSNAPPGTNLEVQMGSRGLAGCPYVPDVLPGGDALTDRHVYAGRPHVRVRGRHPLSVDRVLDDDQLSVTPIRARPN